MKRPRLFLLLLSLLALDLASCKKDDPAAAQVQGGGRGARGAGATFAVDVLATEAKSVDYIVQVPGSIDAFERVQVTARVAGIVDRVAFAEGQNVKKGDTLVLIDSERFQLAVNSAKAALAKAQTAQKDTEAMAERRQGASDQHPGLIPGEEVETYKTKSLTAKADTDVAAESLKVDDPDAHRRNGPIRQHRLPDGDAAPLRSDAPSLPGRTAGCATPQDRDGGVIRHA